ncbi:MAG: hypothetical protein ACYTGB_18525, partial [Planctomycetota bacterium]
ACWLLPITLILGPWYWYFGYGYGSEALMYLVPLVALLLHLLLLGVMLRVFLVGTARQMVLGRGD